MRGWTAGAGRRAPVAAAILFFFGFSAYAQPSKPDTSRPTKIGVFLNAVFDIDPGRDSYAADLYVWSLSPAKGPDPLAQVSFPRARFLTILEKWSEIDGDIFWSVRRFRCEMNEEWDVTDYPFDVHVVNILIGSYAGAAILPPMEVDNAHSGVNTASSSIGWHLSDFHLNVGTVSYATNFGDPSLTADEPKPWVIASFELSRNSWPLFLKLVTGAYVAFAASMLACLMKTDQPPIFAGRVGLQIACLFSIILNHRFTSSSMGKEDIFGLLDTLHLTSYVLLFAAIFVTLRSRVLNERTHGKGAVRFERSATLGLVTIFVLVNLFVISRAILTPPHEDEVTKIFLRER
ncbi:MAG TPA: hypothetical protein VIT23_12745 [Terrimicrobiaceae bacterium]